MDEGTNKGNVSVASIFLIALVLMTSLCSCATSNLRGKLDETARAYGIAVRWKNFEGAETFVAPPIRDPFEKRLKDATDVEVVDYQVVNVEYDDLKKKATVSVEITYNTRSSMRIRKLLDRQVWSFGEPGGLGQWQLTTLLPEFK